MKRQLLFLFVAILSMIGVSTYGQSGLFERTIGQNGGNDTITLSNGQVVVIGTSSDDAEQEDDAMDALYDDDLDIGWEGDPTKLHVVTTGLRFQNINIPANAIIDSAFILFCAHEGKNADDTAKITIIGQTGANVATFDLDNLITARPETQASVSWVVAEEWELWHFYRTPDIKSIVQEIINQQGWVMGNAMGLTLKGINQGPSDFENAREVEAFENIADPEDGGDGKNHPERVAKLMVYYTAPAMIFERSITQNGANDTITLSNGNIVIVGTSSDDAEQEDDAMDALYDDDIDFGWEGDPTKLHTLTAGFRFTDIAIPQGATIDSAFVVFCAHEGKNADDTAKITIVGEATDNANTYDLDNLISNRPSTVAVVNWVVAEEWNLWEFYRTPNIGSIIQEITDRQNWGYGHALALTFKGINQGPSDFENAREVEAFENIADPEDGGDGKNHPERIAKLVVHYKMTTGIGDQHISKAKLDVYPNPVRQGTVTVRMPGNMKGSIRVYNMAGQAVIDIEGINTTLVKMDVSHLPAGIYMVVATQEDTIATQKLIVQ